MVGVCKGEYLGHNPGDEPLTWMRCYSCGLSKLYKTLRGRGLFMAKPVNKGIK